MPCEPAPSSITIFEYPNADFSLAELGDEVVDEHTVTFAARYAPLLQRIRNLEDALFAGDPEPSLLTDVFSHGWIGRSSSTEFRNTAFQCVIDNSDLGVQVVSSTEDINLRGKTVRPVSIDPSHEITLNTFMIDGVKGRMLGVIRTLISEGMQRGDVKYTLPGYSDH